MRTVGKYGRRPMRQTNKTVKSRDVMTRHLTSLGPAPAATNNYIGAVTVPWRMLWNDDLGDCVCADTGHTMMLRTANLGHLIIPPAHKILHLYEEVGGYVLGDPSTDNGCDEVSMEEYLSTEGFMGHKLDNYGTVDETNEDFLVWCVQLFGSCRLGINLPVWAEEAFSNGMSWGLPPTGADVSIAGGHDVPLVDFRDGHFKCITWGEEQNISIEFIRLYCEEAHAELYFDWFNVQGTAPPGFDINQLNSDINNVA